MLQRCSINAAIYNHFSTTGRCCSPPRCDAWIRQATRPAFVMLSFKIFLTQTVLLCGATCYIVPSRTMTRLFNYVNFVYRLRSLSNILQLFASFSQNPNRLQWRMVLTTTTYDLPCYVLDRLFDNLTDKSY